ncbi:hypothetical protein [Hymenobacter perfusus]|uniref:DUF3575 domain-containing protein n=1 Tax=Hymenobacter perfusus TaxID=1236770 RepID=A0A3R9NSP3_9BACT|nr:hypothetical protein [Hymenobacter perfusus]RSK42731.1 hypothetical protein EI293_13095 [Hymenobacter perfusus]
MIHNSSRISGPARLLTALLLGAGLATSAQAQTTPDAPTPNKPPYANALRLDIGGALARNVAHNILNSSPDLLVPVLVGYERQLGRRISGNVEVLVNGGEPDERLSGVALQGRYYLYQGRKTGLLGVYAAPTLSFRSARQQFYYSSTRYTSKLGGAGGLLGVQLPLGNRLLLDVSGGVMTWKRLDETELSSLPSYYRYKTYYEEQGTVFDGRLSLGYRF